MAEPNQLNPYQGYPELEKKRIPWRNYFMFLTAGLFIMAGVLYFAQPKGIQPQERIPSFTASVIMASAIDDSFQYQAQPNNEYYFENPVYIYIDVLGVSQKEDSSVDVVEDIEIKDESGKSVFAEKAFSSNKETYETAVSEIEFSNTIPTSGWKSGKYSAKITITDNAAKKSVTKSISFLISEKSGEIINTVADLSSIVPNAETARLVRQQTVWDSNGNIIPELTFNKTIANDLTNIDLSNIAVDFKMPERYNAGKYIVEITYTNLENGQSKSIRQEINSAKGFAVSDFAFASSIDEFYNFAVQPNNEYIQGSVVYVFMRIVDFEHKQVEDKYSINMALDLYVLNQAGEIIASQLRYLVINDNVNAIQDAYNTKSVFKADFEPGTYTLKAVFKDENSGKEAVKEGSFIIR